jgi:HEAT repeat protein
LELLNDRNGHVRSTSARALGLIGDPSTIKFLFKVLADPYPDVQESAERALMEMKEELPVGSIIELLKSDSSALRCHAALLLGEIKSDETISPLSFLLKDPDENVRKSAVHALGFFDSEKIIQHLTVAFGDEDHRVRLAALKILEHISLEEIEKILDDLVPLFHDENIWVRSEIPRILGRIPGERVFKLLLELLNDGVGAVKISALSVLGNRKEEEALPFLLAQTSHPDIEVKKAAILALGVFGNPSVRVVLHSFLTDPHWAIRASAARAIGNLRNPDSLFELNEMTVSDADPLVREAARIALAQIRGMG